MDLKMVTVDGLCDDLLMAQNHGEDPQRPYSSPHAHSRKRCTHAGKVLAPRESVRTLLAPPRAHCRRGGLTVFFY